MEFLRHIFAFDSDSPLLFTQLYFWVFLVLAYLGFALVLGKMNRQRTHLRNIYLMFVSWFFYYKTSGNFLAILAMVTFTSYVTAFWIEKANARQHRFNAVFWMVVSIVIDLGFLFYYKYAYFGVDVFNSVFGTHYSIVDTIMLPVGISFYTFQVLSYTVDIYRGHVKPVHNIFDYGMYVSFFPQLVAGPIVRASEFIEQLYRPFHMTHKQMGLGVFWILNGLAKKIILSDFIAVNFVDRVFDNPMLFTGFENFFAVFAYSLQVYADFSGYTDIAIGVALLMGFYLPKNFDSPYKSKNPQEFWRRWHQSLSRWLKSYVYIPLGGNRSLFGKKTNKLLASNVNSFATMLIGGLWHGASWNFVIWGALNGIGMIFAKCWHALKEKAGVERLIQSNKVVSKVDDMFCIVLTFTFITFTRLFFRASSNLDPAFANETAWRTAKQMMGQIIGAWDSSIIPMFMWEYRKVVLLFVIGMAIHWLPAKFKQWYRINFAMLPWWMMTICVALVVFIVYQFVTADLQPFIYFQF